MSASSPRAALGRAAVPLLLLLGLGIGAGMLLPVAFSSPAAADGQAASATIEPLSSGAAQPSGPVARAKWANELQQLIYDQMEPYPNGHVSVFVKDVNKGVGLGYRDEKPMYLASGIKLLVMVELYRQREAGLLSFDDELAYRFVDVRDGAPAMNKLPRNQTYPIWELLTYMLRDSDNAAADILMTRVGPDNVRRGALRDGVADLGRVVPLMDVRREVYRRLDPRADRLHPWQVRDVRWRNGFYPRLDILKKHIGPPHGDYDRADLTAAYRAYYKLGRNHAPMRSIGVLLEGIWRGEAVSAAASERMLARLGNVWASGHRIRGAIPESHRVFHKTGTQQDRICDLAIVELSDGRPLIIAIAVADIPRLKAEHILATVAHRAFELAEREPIDLAVSKSQTQNSEL